MPVQNSSLKEEELPCIILPLIASVVWYGQLGVRKWVALTLGEMYERAGVKHIGDRQPTCLASPKPRLGEARGGSLAEWAFPS
eukprot:97059-Pelagomonas_calceolata.AAC.6